MKVEIFSDKRSMGKAAAEVAGRAIREAVSSNGEAFIIVATGASQFEMLESLTSSEGIDWSRVTAFHLDEYVGLGADHPASFRLYLKERFVSVLPGLKKFHYVNAEINPEEECRRLAGLISRQQIDLACIGIGENGHLAFNDPPADFEIEKPYLVVKLDEACRKQQVGEGWFKSIEEVPTQAISMSIRQIMKAKHLVCTVPDARKAVAVRDSVEGPVTNTVPASMLQRHPSCRIFLDKPAAALLQNLPGALL